MNSKCQEEIKQYVLGIQQTLVSLPAGKIEEIIDLLVSSRLQQNNVYILGNGGSAATASHFTNDLCKGANRNDKPRIRAFALVDNMPLVSAWANDSSYENIFAEQIENYVNRDDIVIAISGSGNSPNVLNGVKKAQQKGAKTIALTGFDGGGLKNIVDIAVIVPSNNMEQIEDVHLMICHLISTCLRNLP